MSKQQIIADMQRTIRNAREAIHRLEAGDYSGCRYCTGAEAARYIINRHQSAITAAERVIADLTSPEDLA